MCRRRAIRIILTTSGALFLGLLLLAGLGGVYVYLDSDLSFARRQADRFGLTPMLRELASGRAPVVTTAETGPAQQSDPELDPLIATANESGVIQIAINNGDPSHTISPLIYGINFSEEETITDLNIAIRRWGGNATTRYSWEYDNSNRASDWFFQNYPNDLENPELLPVGSSSDGFVEFGKSQGVETIITVPLIGWAPIDREFRCAFSVSKYGAQQFTDPYNGDCGNGVYPDGQLVTGNDPADTSKPIDTAYVEGWMNHLTSQFGTAAEGGVEFYSLDNEPMLWHQTHRDIFPQPLGYAEIRDRTYEYGAAVKAADPTALTLGPVAWGWSVYFESALDLESDTLPLMPGPDRREYSKPFVPWYLSQMKAYEDQNGVRILDYLDLHYYPAQANVALSSAVDPPTQELRLRSTRSLWDPTYVDESWIGEPVRLIPRMQAWVDTEYPGTKLALTEYNFGALNHINGGLTQADILGIFGREQLGLATLWDPPQASDPGAFAFRMYRNYDGNMSAFGDLSLTTISSNQDAVAAYASRRSGDDALTIMLINKTDVTQPIDILFKEGITTSSSIDLYRYSAENLGEITLNADTVGVAENGLTGNLPPQSITLLVIN
ncbi:MAG: glycoside hydrolase family 44 protein [Chloroflexota bacterium]